MKRQLWDLKTGNYLETLNTDEEVEKAIADYVYHWVDWGYTESDFGTIEDTP